MTGIFRVLGWDILGAPACSCGRTPVTNDTVKMKDERNALVAAQVVVTFL